VQERYPHVDLENFTEKHLVDWLLEQTCGDTTRTNYRSHLKGFFTWAHTRDLIPSNPAARLTALVPVKPVPVAVHRWMERSEIEDVLGAVPDTLMGVRDMAILRLGFGCGLRRTEIASLNWGDVDLERREIRVVGKNRKAAVVAVSDSLASTLSHLRVEAKNGLDGVLGASPVIVRFRRLVNFATGEVSQTPEWGQRLSGSGVYNVVRRYGKFSPHDMRRSFAGQVHKLAGIEATSAALRHSNLGTTQVYLEKRADAAARAVRKAGWDI